MRPSPAAYGNSVLLQLRIKNFAIIDDCSVTFGPGMVALTGETGAGKSIIMDALSLCLGSRAGAESVRHTAATALLEAVFEIRELPGSPIEDFLREYGVERDPGGVLSLSREVFREGRSIARINGRTVPATLLSSIGNALADLHGQSEHLSLLRPARQLDMLDHFGHLDVLRLQFSNAAATVVQARSAWAELTSNRRAAEQQLDLLRFQQEEIARAQLRSGEVEELATERQRLANAEKLAVLVSEALGRLQDDEVAPPAIENLAAATTALTQLAEIDPSTELIRDAASELRYLADDLAVTLRRYRDTIEFDPPRLDEVEARMAEIDRLRRKYGETVEEVLTFLEETSGQLALVEDYEERMASAEAAVGAAEEAAAGLGVELSVRRTEAGARFAAKVHDRLAQLGLGPARFEVSLSRRLVEDGLGVDIDGHRERVEFTASGIDHIQFLVSFNTGEPLKPIEKVASGGETARFMLAVKAVLADTDDVPTLIFDEIDTGVGGRGGPVVADMMRELAETHQVITITHLPQIAAKANLHLRVRKIERFDGTGVVVEELDREGRVREIAEMLAGARPSEHARRSAEELLPAG